MANVKDLLVNGSARVIGTIYGNATSANKLNTNAGSISQPVYFSNGIPVAITGTISNNAATATKATQDSAGQQINTTYIKGLSVSGRTITYTKGDGTTGTITTQDNNTTYSAGTGLSLSGTTFNHKNSVTAGTAQGDANKTLTFGGTFTIPTITYDAQGHVTGKGTTTMTMPANPNTDTHWTTGITAGATGTTSNSATTNGNTFIKIKDNSTHRGQIKLVGSGATSVSSDANGVITISSTDNNTTYGSMSISEGTTGTATSNRVLTATNLKGIINALAPTKTGGGASDTWGLNISGKAAGLSCYWIDNNLTVAQAKDQIRSKLTNKGIAAAVLSSSYIYQWNTDTASYYGASMHSIISLNPGYNNTTYGHFLVAHVGDNDLHHIGVGESNWGRLRTLLDSVNYTSYTVTKTGSGASGNWGISISGNSASASKVNNKLTVGSKTFDGSAAVTIAASDLGLASAMLFLGTTTPAITDGAKTNPVVIGGSNKTVTAGNVVLYGSKEFVWTGNAWEELGNEGSYKIVQAAVGDPSASGTSNTFIATVSQDANGKITATKKTVAVTNSAPTLSWGATSTVGTVAGTNLQVKMPANPNTWRGIQNNLTSDSTTDSLSAAQGKALKSLVDGKAAASHTHNYAGSSSAGGTANAANKVVSRGNHTEAASGTTANSPTTGMLDSSGMYMTQTYNDSATPASYGNIINLAGNGTGQLMCEWSGSDNTLGHLYYRSHRDTNTGGWSNWGKVAFVTDNVASATKATKDSAGQQINTTYIKGLSVSGRTITYTKGDGSTGTITTQDTNTTYSNATTSAAGLMSKDDKAKLDGIAAGANKYSHPTSSGNKHIPAGGSSGQILRWSADGTAVWGADTNTWRGIQNNLTSDSTTDSLAAAQGKALKALIDGKAASSHTHNYAGSSSAGGAANSAVKLSTARTITLSGAVTGSASFDGSKNITITTSSSQQTLPYSSSTSQLFVTSTANQASYTLSNFVDNAVYHVYVNGFKIPSSEYTVSSSGVVTLTNPPELANQEVEIVANYTSYVTTDSSIYNSSYLNYYRQATAPSNTNALWLDTSTTTSSSSFTPKLYDGGKWNAIGGVDTATLDARYVKKSGDTVSGVIRSTYKSGTWVNSLTNSVISIDDHPGDYGGWICGPTKDGRIAISTYEGNDNTLYFGYGEKGRTTNSFTQQMTWNGPANTLSAGKVYGAVWNDYAEYRQSNITEPGRVVIENGDGTLSLSTKRLQRGAEVISDTYGFAIGETDECKTPIAATGRVLAYTYEPIEEYKSKIGWPVCSGPNGTVSIMTEEEEEKYPSRIIGTISEVPNYEEWGTGKVKTNGRVWIRIK